MVLCYMHTVRSHEEKRGKAYAVPSREQLLGEAVEGIRVFLEERDVKDGLGVRQVEPLEVVVESCSWGPEVLDPCGCRDSCTTHHNDILGYITRRTSTKVRYKNS